jgi:hypothetical protein
MNKRYKLTISLFALALSAFAFSNRRHDSTSQGGLRRGLYYPRMGQRFCCQPQLDQPRGTDSRIFGPTLASFQSDVVSLHPAIVHIMVGLTLVTSFLTRVHCSISRAL